MAFNEHTIGKRADFKKNHFSRVLDYGLYSCISNVYSYTPELCLLLGPNSYISIPATTVNMRNIFAQYTNSILSNLHWLNLINLAEICITQFVGG